MRAILISTVAGLVTAGAIALIGPAEAATPRAYAMNAQGGVIACHLAATDTEVEWCAGELPASSPANPARFDCRTAEVDSEYRFCGLPFPKRAK